MPTVLIIEGYRFFFYSNENDEPPHIHVGQGRHRPECKFWLDPVLLARNFGFSPRDLNHIKSLVDGHVAEFLGAWDEHFGN